MDHYIIWFNLKDSHKDLEFAKALREYLGHLQTTNTIAAYSLARRKLGFGPRELGEFEVRISVTNMAALDAVFDIVAARSGVTEQLHARVYSMVTDFRAALYRDFPDRQRS